MSALTQTGLPRAAVHAKAVSIVASAAVTFTLRSMSSHDWVLMTNFMNSSASSSEADRFTVLYAVPNFVLILSPPDLFSKSKITEFKVSNASR